MGKQTTKAATKKQAPVSKKPVKSPKKIVKPVKSSPKKAPVINVPKKPAPKKAASSPAPAKKAPKQKKPKVPSGPKGYTADQYQTFKTWKGKFEEYSNQELKDLLRKNLQSMTGNKDELIYKCADGATLGRIPRCPKCFGGRPKFDFQKGTYFCSGFRDDTEFQNCHTTFELSEITRDPWEN